MACGSAINVRVEPSDLTYEIEEKWCIETIADVSESLDATYFTMDTASTGYYVWCDIGAAADPAPAGRTGLAATISANDTAAAVATAIQTVVDAHANFAASVSGAEVTITHIAEGDVSPTADVDTAFVFTQLQEGGELELGLTEGDISVTFNESLLPVTAHQTGVTPLLDLRQGVIVEDITVAMQETDIAKLKQIFSKHAGGAETPSGGTEVQGWGTSRVGTNTIVQARRLIFHPSNLAAADLTRDLCFWKAYLMPESIVYSGENKQIVNVKFKVYKDEDKNDVINYFIFGDHTQYDPT